MTSIKLIKDGIYNIWHYSYFKDDIGVAYTSVGQYMMFMKAVLFKDYPIAKLILNSPFSSQQKRFGKLIEHYSSAVWLKHCRMIAFNGNYFKFSQNNNLKSQLMGTSGLLALAKKSSSLWGIGLCKENPDAMNITKWKGFNWMGEDLTALRLLLESEKA